MKPRRLQKTEYDGKLDGKAFMFDATCHQPFCKLSQECQATVEILNYSCFSQVQV